VEFLPGALLLPVLIFQFNSLDHAYNIRNFWVGGKYFLLKAEKKDYIKTISVEMCE